MWTSSLLGYLLDFDKPGFNQELVRRLRERGAMGEAAGAAAAVAAASRTAPHDVPWSEVKPVLELARRSGILP